MPITQWNENDSERNKYQQQRYSPARQTDEIVLNFRVNGMKNQRYHPRKPVDENRAGCLQKCVVCGYEKIENIYF
jgi:hypothetical protein